MSLVGGSVLHFGNPAPAAVPDDFKSATLRLNSFRFPDGVWTEPSVGSNSGFRDSFTALLLGKIARHEFPDWCQSQALPYQHSLGLAPTLDVGCYPSPAGAVTGAPGSDLLTPKKQIVVDRLKKRFGVYRKHQNVCQSRYNQAANGLYDAQRLETQALKQKVLEAKAKKTRRNDHHGRNAASSDHVQRNNVNQSKVKRQAASPLLDCNIDNATDGLPSKIPRKGTTNDKFCRSATTPPVQQQPSQQSSISSFSGQVVPQFSSTTSPAQPQTLQTNVTVQTLPNHSIKTSNSPLASNVISTTSSPGCAGSGTSANDSYNQLPNSGVTNSGAVPSSSTSVGTNIECKQEPDTNFGQCNVNESHQLPELNNEFTSANNNENTTSSTAATTGDRFSDSLANLGFPEDSNDDVIHPDILKDIIDDVFTNPSDFQLNGFNFMDNLGLKENNHNINDEKDSIKLTMSLDKSIQNNFPNSANSPSIFSVSQPQQNVFEFQSGVNSTNTSQTVPNNTNVSQGCQSGRLGSYATSSPNLSGIANNGLGLDFKLTEPSPAAQTLKQMAEQHQSMQQKQQQLGIVIGSNHPRSPFGSDSFPDPLSSMRTSFMNGSPTSVQKSPTGLFQPMGFSQQNFSPANAPTIKQEVCTPNTPLYQSNINQHLPDMDLQKRRQVIQMQQNQIGTVTRPSFSHSPDQKRQYQSIRSLPHYNDPSPVHPPNEDNTSNSPIPHPGQLARSVSTPGVTPPPQSFGSSPATSTGSNLHMSQNQHMQMSTNNQQLQVSQPQHLLLSKDKICTVSSQQDTLHAKAFYSGQNTLRMQQPHTMSFQFPNAAIRGDNPITNQRSNTNSHLNSLQRQGSQQYISKPPPDYPTSIDPNNCNNHAIKSGSLCQNNPVQMKLHDGSSDQNARCVDQRNNTHVNLPQSYLTSSDTTQTSYSGMLPINQMYPEIFLSNNNSIAASRSRSNKSQSNTNTNARRPYSGTVMTDLVSRSCSAESPSSDNSNVDRPFPGIIPINNLIPRPSTNESTLNNSNVDRPFPGIIPINNVKPRPSVNESTSNSNLNARKPFQNRMADLMSRQNANSSTNNTNSESSFSSIPINDLVPRNNPDFMASGQSVSDSSEVAYLNITSMQGMADSNRTYSGLLPTDNMLLNTVCSNSGSPSNVNSPIVSQSYQSSTFPHPTPVSGVYTSISSVLAMTGEIYSQASHSLLSHSSTITSSTATAKGRGKQVVSRVSSGDYQCNSLRQQKPPNVNVGPEGLNISQRPPALGNEWRPSYLHQNQHQVNSNINNNLIVKYTRNGTDEFRIINNANMNSFQSGRLNPNSIAGDNSSVLTITQSNNQAQMHPNSIQDRTNQLIMQSQAIAINDNSFQNSQIQLSGVSASDMNQSNIFPTSSSPNNTLQNIVPDNSQFSLDFLDNMDCSTSDLLNFDVMQGENSNFPTLDDITMLDK